MEKDLGRSPVSPERLAMARWILERQLAAVGSADAKIGMIVAIDTAMLGGLAAATSRVAQLTGWTMLLAVFAAACSAASIFCVAMTVRPRLDGPKKSLIFFRRVAETQADEYKEKLRISSDDALLDDCAAQIHRNAEIARDKHRWVQAAMNWSFCASVPWMAAVGLLVKP